MISNFVLHKETSLQITFNYLSPWVMPQGESLPMYYLDAGFKSDFLKNQFSLNLTFNDILNTRRFGIQSEGLNFESEFIRKRESRLINLQLTYRFGNQDANKRRSNRNENQDMQQNNFDMF